LFLLLRLTGDEEQVGGFDLIYKNNKRVKNGMKNLSFLGCLNNRLQQMPKMAKQVALRLAEKVREEKMNEARQQKNQQNKNIRNKSTNIPSNHYINKQSSATSSNPSPNNPQAPMNKSGNPVRKPPTDPNAALVKLPKVATIGNSSVSNSSMKAIWEGGGKRSNHENGSKEGHRK